MAEEEFYDDRYTLEEEPVDISEATPRILLMGSRRAGKSSLAGVVFNKLPPHETLFMESGQLEIKYVANNAFVQFQVWDFPGNFDFEREELTYAGQVVSAQVAFGACAVLVYVVDAQDEPYQDAMMRLVKTIQIARAINPDIAFEVFVHKVDGELFLTDEQKMDCQQEVQQTALDEFADVGLSPDTVHLNFHLTSIYDHTTFEAFSKVVRKLLPEQLYSSLENLLNDFISNSNMDKSFLFDVVSKIYIATDSNPVDMQSYELCADMIDVVIDVSCIYGLQHQQHTITASEASSSTPAVAAPSEATAVSPSGGNQSEGGGGDGSTADAESTAATGADTAAAAAAAMSGGGEADEEGKDMSLTATPSSAAVQTADVSEAPSLPGGVEEVASTSSVSVTAEASSPSAVPGGTVPGGDGGALPSSSTREGGVGEEKGGEKSVGGQASSASKTNEVSSTAEVSAAADVDAEATGSGVVGWGEASGNNSAAAAATAAGTGDLAAAAAAAGAEEGGGAGEVGSHAAAAGGNNNSNNNSNNSKGWAYDSSSASVIKLSNGMVLYLREVNSYLALVCLLRAENMTKRGLIDYNIDCFKRALVQVFQQHRVEPPPAPTTAAQLPPRTS